MSETVITVQGHFSAFYPAERATVDVTVGFEGKTRAVVFDAVKKSADAVRDSIAGIHDATAGPVTWWSSDRISVWTEKPWNNEGKQLPPVFHSSISFTAKFSDFGRLGEWVEQVAAIDGVTVGGIRWALTDARTTSVTAEVRSRAVKDAVDKARVFAQSIGLATVSPIALSDPGMLGDGSSGGGQPYLAGAMRMARSDSMGGGALTFKPQDIEVSASVDARFSAS